MKRVKRFVPDLIILLGFFVLPLLLFGDVTVGGQTMLPVDNLYQAPPWVSYAGDLAIDQPQNPLISDLIVQNFVWKQFIREGFTQPQSLLWNPHSFAGVPFLAAGQHSAYYPFSVLFLIMPLANAYGWFALSQLWLAGALMYVYGRILKMRRSSATIAGLVFQGGGFIVVSAAVFPMIIAAVVWIPLLLACIEKVIEDGLRRRQSTFIWAALGSVALGAQVLAGHIEYTIYTLLIMGAYALWRLIAQTRITEFSKRYLRNVSIVQTCVWLAGMVTVGMMFAAIQLIPLYEVGQVNFREGSTEFEQVLKYAFPARRVLTLAMPNFFGNPAHHEVVDVIAGEVVPITQDYYGNARTTTEWGIKNYVEGGIYLGILPLFLAVLGVFGGLMGEAGGRKGDLSSNNDVRLSRPYGGTRRSITIFYLVLGFFSLAFIFGTPLYAILYYGLPFVNQLHTPFRWVFPLSLTVAVLAGFGMDYLSATRKWQSLAEWRARKELANVWASDNSVVWWKRPFFLWGTPSIITGLAGLTLWVGLLLLLGLFMSRIAYEPIAPFVENVYLGMAKAPEGFPSAQLFFSYEWRQAFIFALMLIGSGATLRVSRCPIFVGRWGGRRPIWLYMTAVLIVLDIFVANYGFHASNDADLVAFKPEVVPWLEQQPGHWRMSSFVPKGWEPLRANAGWMYGFEDVRGYDSIIPKQFTDYMGAIEPQNRLAFNQVQPITNWESLNSPLLDVLGVKYVLTAEPEGIDLPKYELVWQGENVRVYENLGVAPRAYTLPIAQTAVVADPLAAMTTEYDPRQFVVISEGDWRFVTNGHEIGDSSLPNLQSPLSDFQPATITHYDNIEVVLETAVSEPSWLVLNDSDFPGWKAYIKPLGVDVDEDGEEIKEEQVEITLVNGNFRGVQLEPGEWTVRFRYSPVSFQLGGLISFMGVILLLFGTAVWAWQLIVRPTDELSVTRSIAKNSLAPIALNLFNKFIDFVFAMFYLRVLGPEGAGSFQTAIVTAGIFEILANFGLDILLIRDVSQDRRKASHYLYNTSILRLGLALFACLPVFVIIAVTQVAPQTEPLTAAEILATILIMVGMVFSGLSKGITGLFYVHEEAEVPNTITTVTTILKVAFGVIALLIGLGFVGLAGVSILTNVITVLILLVLALRRYTLQGPWTIDRGLQRKILRAGFPLMLIHLLQTVFISIDTYLLRVMLTDGRLIAGYYSSAYKWFNALQVIPSFFTLALFPIISREIKKSIDSARTMLRMSLKLMYLLALPIAAITFFLAYPLVGIVGGREFLPDGAIALQIVIWSIPIGWMNSVINYVLISLGMERMQPRAFTIAVAFNIITNLIFIPMFTYKAAGVTTILSEVVLIIVFNYYLRKKMEPLNWARFLWKPALVTAVMVAAMWAGGQVHIIVGLALGALIYPAGLFILRVVGPEEKRILADILPAPIVTRLKLHP